MKVLVLDDTPHGASQTQVSIREGGGRGVIVDMISGEDLRRSLDSFFAMAVGKIQQAQSGKQSTENIGQFSEFDKYDVIFIDNNLTLLPANDAVSGAPLTAEVVVGFMRAFSNVNYLVSLNKNPDVDFDLTALVGDRTTFADLGVNTKHLSLSSLWSDAPASRWQFAPTYWPRLPLAAANRRKQIRKIASDVDQSVLALLGIDMPKVAALSERALGALAPQQPMRGPDNGAPQNWTDVTVKDFLVHACRSLPHELRVGIVEDTDAVARIVAAELEAWVRRDVVAPQDAIVTVPQLISRMPFLLENSSKITSWNAAAASTRPPYGLDQTLYRKYIAKHRTQLEVWSGSATFWWDAINDEERLARLFSPAGSTWGDFVFCEDASRFVERAPKGKVRKPAEFSADVNGAWRRRFVAKFRDFEYSPQARFAQ